MYETTRNFLEIIENKKYASIFNHFDKDPDICRYLVYTELPPPEMADWDADDFEPDTASASVAARPSDKWDGEDEDDDIKVRLIIKSFENKTILLHKDAWDAESEEENSEKSEEAKPVKVKKKKNLAQKIAEKEEAAQLAKLEKLKREEEEREANTPEGEFR